MGNTYLEILTIIIPLLALIGGLVKYQIDVNKKVFSDIASMKMDMINCNQKIKDHIGDSKDELKEIKSDINNIKEQLGEKMEKVIDLIHEIDLKISKKV